MIESQRVWPSQAITTAPIVSLGDSDYLKGLLGVDQYKKFVALAQKLREQIEKQNINPNEIFEHLIAISDVHIKLTNLERHQIRTLGRMIGWIHDIAFALSEFYKVKVHVFSLNSNSKDIEEIRQEVNHALIELAKLLLRFVNLYEFWIGILMSQNAYAFDKLTSRTVIQHTYENQSDVEKKKKWWWF